MTVEHSDHMLWRGSRVVELRRYLLVPGRRDELIALFERELLDPQEHIGMRVLGQFRCPENPDLFVWIRGFETMAGRPAQLDAFYNGPVWAEHADAANATMVDSDNVLLLRPLLGEDRDTVDPAARIEDRPLTLTIHPVLMTALSQAAQLIEMQLSERPERGGVVAVFASETVPNNFPRLPVREDGAFVVSLESTAGSDAQLASADPTFGLPAAIMAGEPEIINLVPTARCVLSAAVVCG